MTQASVSRMFLVLASSIGCGAMLGCGSAPGGSTGRAAVLESVKATQNPLVAQYTIATDCPGQIIVEFGPDTSYGRTTSSFYTPGGYHQASMLVAGMRPSTVYHMRSQLQCADGETADDPDMVFTTGPLPALPFPAMAITRPNPSATSPENPGVEMISVSAVGTPAFFTDRDGNIIWYYDVGQGNAVAPFKLLPNGHILLLIALGSTDTVLREIDLAGNTIREIDEVALQEKMYNGPFDFFPGGFTHDFLYLPNGHLIALVACFKNFTDLPGYPGVTLVQGDALVDLDQNLNPVWTWNSFDYLDVNRHLNGLPDWTHSNALVYSASDGNLLLSMRHQSWVLKIDYNNGAGSGNVLWKLGYQGDFALTQNAVPSDDPSLWFSFQHFPSIITQSGAQTTLAIWDNGDNRVLDSGGDICGAGGFPACYSRPAVFQIDESSLVADLQWADPLQYFGVWGGSINQLGADNIEYDLNAPLVPPSNGVASEVQEITQTSTPQVVWQMDITPATANAYRAYRVPSLYPGVNWQY